jgi:hypothetical protein
VVDGDATSQELDFTSCESPPGPPSAGFETAVAYTNVEVLNDDDEVRV